MKQETPTDASHSEGCHTESTHSELGIASLDNSERMTESPKSTLLGIIQAAASDTSTHVKTEGYWEENDGRVLGMWINLTKKTDMAPPNRALREWEQSIRALRESKNRDDGKRDKLRTMIGNLLRTMKEHQSAQSIKPLRSIEQLEGWSVQGCWTWVSKDDRSYNMRVSFTERPWHIQ